MNPYKTFVQVCLFFAAFGVSSVSIYCITQAIIIPKVDIGSAFALFFGMVGGISLLVAIILWVIFYFTTRGNERASVRKVRTIYQPLQVMHPGSVELIFKRNGKEEMIVHDYYTGGRAAVEIFKLPSDEISDVSLNGVPCEFVATVN